MSDDSDIQRYTDSQGRKVARHTNVARDYQRAFGTSGAGGRQRAQAIADTADQLTDADMDVMHARQHSDTNNGY